MTSNENTRGYAAYYGALQRSVLLGWLFGGTLGAAGFLYLWGTTPLDPYNFDWIVRPFGTDPSFVAIGSLRFLKERWSFPPGIIHGLISPAKTSILYVDGIPFVALLAKLIMPLIGRDFQYIGPWGMFCMIMQGGMSTQILMQWRRDAFSASVGSLIFIFSPFIIGRMFGHISMTGQWVLLYPLLLVTARHTPWIRKNDFVLWPLATCVSIGILPYFTPMVIMIEILYFSLAISERRDGYHVKRSIKTFAISIVALIPIFWLLGGFVPGNNYGTMDYGFAPYNLNAMINPGWGSHILQPLGDGAPIISSGEGQSWVGLGVVIGAIYLAMRALLDSKGALNLSIVLPYFVICILLVGFAATNQIMFGGTVLFRYEIAPWLIHVFSVFRSSARFIWPVWYIVVFFIVGNIISLSASAIRSALLLLILSIIQIVDNSAFIVHRSRADFVTQPPDPITDPFWTKMAQVADHLIIAPYSGRIMGDHQRWGYLAYNAVRDGLSLNSYWLGRYPASVSQSANDVVTELVAGNIGDRDLVLFQYPIVLTDKLPPSSVHAYLAGTELLFSKQSDLPEGAHKAIIQHATLASYLRHLKLLAPHCLIVLTERDAEKVHLDNDTARAFNELAMGGQFQDQMSVEYAGVMQSGKVLFEVFDHEQVHFLGRSGDVMNGERLAFNVDLDLATSQNWPKIVINGMDSSYTWFGLNASVYDLESGQMVEFGSFSVGSETSGVFVSAIDQATRVSIDK